MLLGQHCSSLSTILNSIVTPESTRVQVFTLSNNVLLSKLFNFVNNIVKHCYARLLIHVQFWPRNIFNAVFFTPKQFVHFQLCT